MMMETKTTKPKKGLIPKLSTPADEKRHFEFRRGGNTAKAEKKPIIKETMMNLWSIGATTLEWWTCENNRPTMIGEPIKNAVNGDQIRISRKITVVVPTGKAYPKHFANLIQHRPKPNENARFLNVLFLPRIFLSGFDFLGGCFWMFFIGFWGNFGFLDFWQNLDF